MGDGQDSDVFAEIHEDHRVRKPREQRPANHQILREIKPPRKQNSITAGAGPDAPRPKPPPR